MIEENVRALIKSLPEKNPLGEKITLVGATKTRSVEEINRAISAGLKDIGENKAQEFRDKYPLVSPCNYHFFGRLQKNKVKYLIGKALLIQSVDDIGLAKEISRLSLAAGVNTDILIEVNHGEEQKGGVPIGNAEEFYSAVSAIEGLTVKGVMTVLPPVETSDERIIREKCLQTRNIYDILKKRDSNISILSMGMSADFRLAIECGSNMIRLGHAIFGKRDYEV